MGNPGHLRIPVRSHRGRCFPHRSTGEEFTQQGVQEDQHPDGFKHGGGELFYHVLLDGALQERGKCVS